MLPVVQPRAFQLALVEREAEGLDQMKRCTGGEAGTPGIARVPMNFRMNEDDVQHALKQPFVSVGSDSGSPPAKARAMNVATHPRAYGTFSRVAGHYVREVKLFSLEEAVRKMTSQAADRATFTDRGILRPGMKADIIVFDADQIRDNATFEAPNQFSSGVEDVIVNGVPVLRDGAMTGALPGRTVRGKGYRR